MSLLLPLLYYDPLYCRKTPYCSMPPLLYHDPACCIGLTLTLTLAPADEELARASAIHKEYKTLGIPQGH